VFLLQIYQIQTPNAILQTENATLQPRRSTLAYHFCEIETALANLGIVNFLII
jgi:hypothetical protein